MALNLYNLMNKLYVYSRSKFIDISRINECVHNKYEKMPHHSFINLFLQYILHIGTKSRSICMILKWWRAFSQMFCNHQSINVFDNYGLSLTCSCMKYLISTCLLRLPFLLFLDIKIATKLP